MEQTQNRVPYPDKNGCFEELIQRIRQLTWESRDPYFTEYLQKLEKRARQEKYQVDLMAEELNRSYRLYLTRNGLEGQAGQPMPGQAQPVPGQGQPVSGQPMPGQSQPIPIIQPQPQPWAGQAQAAWAPASGPAPAPRKNKEFTVGISVFSVVGVVFVLAAFVMLGMNFMEGMLKGLCMYAIALVIWGFAEFFIKRRSQTLSLIFSSLGIAGLYMATMVNYLSLRNMNTAAAILVTAAVTLAVLLASRRKESGILRMIGILACYLSVLMLDVPPSPLSYIGFICVIFLINLMCIFLPVQKLEYPLGLGHMAAVAVFSQIFLLRTLLHVSFAGQRWEPVSLWERTGLGYCLAVYLVTAFLTLEIILWKLLRKKEEDSLKVLFGVSALMLAGCVLILLTAYWGEWRPLAGILLGAAAVLGALFFYLTRFSSAKWLQYYLAAGMALATFGLWGNPWESAAALLAVLALGRVCSFDRAVRAGDAVFTAVAVLAMLLDRGWGPSLLLLGGLLLSIPLIRRWQTYHESVILAGVFLLVWMRVEGDLKLPLMILVLLFGTLLFNNVRRLAGKGIRGLNYAALAAEICCYLVLTVKDYPDFRLIYVLFAALGLGIILLTLQPRYGFSLRWKNLAVSGFLAYMVLVSEFPVPILTSILLMAVGLLSIGMGFYLSDKKLRIFGLTLCLLVCFKIALFDFYGVEIVQRMILFFSVGIAALVISGIYVLLEKKYSEGERR